MAKKERSIVEMYQEKARTGNPSPTEVATRDLQMFHSVMGNLPNPDPILRKAGKQITVYEDLIYDDQVGHSIEALELAIQAMPWEIDDNGAGDAWADECRAMIEDWDNERIFGEVANARLFGFQPMEILWEIGNRWWIKDIVGKPPEWFFYNDENELRLRKNGISKGIELSDWNFITPRNKPSYKNPYGIAALSRCFWPVAFKKGGLKFWLKFVEKYGMPFLVGKQPRNAGQKATDKLLDELENMVQDAVAVIPDDSSVDILEAGGKGASGDLFEKMVRYHDGSIAKAIQGQTLTSSQGDQGTGSYALGKEHRETFDNVKMGVAKQVKRVYDGALERVTEANKGGPAPKFNWIEDEDVQKDRAERDLTLSQTGQIRFTGEYYKNRYNLEDDEFEIVERQEETPPGNFSQGGKVSPFEGGARGMAKPTKAAPKCPCGCNGDPIVHFEQQAKEELPEDQAALEEATKDSPQQKRMYQQQMEKALRPVLEIIQNYESYEQAMNEMAGLYPEMDAAQLEDRLARAMFVAEVWGRLSVQQEEENEGE